MGSKLVTTNTYLRDPAAREQTVFASVASSSGIEGIHAPFVVLAGKRAARKTRSILKRAPRKSAPRTKHSR